MADETKHLYVLVEVSLDLTNIVARGSKGKGSKGNNIVARGDLS